MKKLIVIAAVLVLLPSITHAAFQSNLKYGMRGSDVFQLQDLLNNEGCLNTQSSGYFGLLTLKGVQCFQTKYNLPATGYFGVLSRTQANNLLVDVTASSTAAEVAETGTTTSTTLCPAGFTCTPVQNQPVTVPVSVPIPVNTQPAPQGTTPAPQDNDNGFVTLKSPVYSGTDVSFMIKNNTNSDFLMNNIVVTSTSTDFSQEEMAGKFASSPIANDTESQKVVPAGSMRVFVYKFTNKLSHAGSFVLTVNNLTSDSSVQIKGLPFVVNGQI